MKIKGKLGAKARVGAAAICAVITFFPLSAGAQNIQELEAGPIWNQDHAVRVCPDIAAKAGGRWTGQWRTVVPGERSVCSVEFQEDANTQSEHSDTVAVINAVGALLQGDQAALERQAEAEVSRQTAKQVDRHTSGDGSPEDVEKAEAIKAVMGTLFGTSAAQTGGMAGDDAPQQPVQTHSSQTVQGGMPQEQVCYNMVQDKVAWNWNGDKNWGPENVQALCGNSKVATATVNCFEAVMKVHDDWRRGVTACSN